MIIDRAMLKVLAEEVNSPERKQFRVEDYKRWLMFNGKTLEIIREAIQKEFAKAETIEELSARIVPINIVNKIIIKLAKIYNEDPSRLTKDRNDEDEALMNLWVEEGSLNQSMKEANRYFKLFKRNLMEIFVDDIGYPHFRNLPRHTYEVFSMDPMLPHRPDVVCKIISDDKDLTKQKLAFWSHDSYWITNGQGEVDAIKMDMIQNPEGINPYKYMPFVYINESTTSVDPLPDDDLVRVAITIPVVLTDLVMATKYQTFSIIYTIGDVGDVPSNPNSVVPLNFGPNGEKPEIGTVTPTVDTDKVLALVTNVLAMLLSTKNLATATINNNFSVQEASSGISKMIDQAESVEDKKDQEAYFEKAEQDLWWFIKTYGLPYWRSKNMLVDDLNREFSAEFEPVIVFKEPKVLLSEEERIKLSALKIQSGFSTLRRELAALNPQLSGDEIEDMVNEIMEERNESRQAQVEYINQGVDDADRAGEDEEEQS